MKIKLFITGGTIDVYYNYQKGKVEHDQTHIYDMLSRGRVRANVETEQLMLVDSRELTYEKRELILNKCKNADTDKIIITHGTDTMAETAEFLGKNLQEKTVVLIGAMIPYVFKGSDALFNLGAAITAVQLLEPGVYITMNGKVFDYKNVKKNFDLSEFQEKKAVAVINPQPTKKPTVNGVSL